MISDAHQNVQNRFWTSQRFDKKRGAPFSETPTVEGRIFTPGLAGNFEVQNPIADSKKICR